MAPAKRGVERTAKLVGVSAFLTCYLVVIARSETPAREASIYIFAQALAAAAACSCALTRPRASIALQALVGLGSYIVSGAAGLPMWNHPFPQDPHAAQLLAKYLLVFASATVALALFKNLASERVRTARARTFGVFTALVLGTNVLWTTTYACDGSDPHCVLVAIEAVVLVLWLGANVVHALAAEREPLVEWSRPQSVVEMGASAPAFVYVHAALSLEWVVAYTAWNVGFVIQHLSDAALLQDASFWLAMLYLRSRDAAPRELHAYFYEARAVTLGAYMSMSALCGVALPYVAVSHDGQPWSAADGSAESYAGWGTQPALRFAAALNLGISIAYTLSALAGALRAVQLARDTYSAPALHQIAPPMSPPITPNIPARHPAAGRATLPVKPVKPSERTPQMRAASSQSLEDGLGEPRATDDTISSRTGDDSDSNGTAASPSLHAQDDA